ncbi:MAG: leucine-rich repeat protein [Mycoplasma sp.]
MKDKELENKGINNGEVASPTEELKPKKKKVSTWKIVTGAIILSLFITGMTTNLYYLVNKKEVDTPVLKTTNVTQKMEIFKGNLEELKTEFDYTDADSEISKENIEKYFNLKDIHEETTFKFSKFEMKVVSGKTFAELTLTLSKVWIDDKMDEKGKSFDFSLELIMKNTEIHPQQEIFTESCEKIKKEIGLIDGTEVFNKNELVNYFDFIDDVETSTYQITKFEVKPLSTRGVRELIVEITPSKTYVNNVETENSQVFTVPMKTTEADVDTLIESDETFIYGGSKEEFITNVLKGSFDTELDLGEVETFSKVINHATGAKYQVQSIDFEEERNAKQGNTTKCKVKATIKPTKIYDKDVIIENEEETFEVKFSTTEESRETEITLTNEEYSGTLDDLKLELGYTSPEQNIDVANLEKIFTIKNGAKDAKYYINSIEFESSGTKDIESSVEISIMCDKWYVNDEIVDEEKTKPFTIKTMEKGPQFVIEDGTILIDPTWKESSSFNVWDGKLEIPLTIDGQDVTKIGDDFSNGISDKLLEVSFENTDNKITEIGNSAFKDCQSLTSDIQFEKLTKIGSSAFEGCSALKGNITLSDGAEIGKSAFKNSGFDGELTLPSDITAIPDNAFENAKISSLNLDLEQLTSIGVSSFAECENLGINEWDISNVETIGDSAFAGSTKIQKLVVSEEHFDEKNATSGWANGFWNGLETDQSNVINIKDRNPIVQGMFTIAVDGTLSIRDTSLWDYENWSGELVIPSAIDGRKVQELISYNTSETPFSDGIKEKIISIEILAEIKIIPMYAFSSCKQLSSIKLPNTITEIEGQAFAGCSNTISELTLPEKLEKIGNTAFHDSGLTSIKSFPETLKTIEYGAFMGCTKLSGTLDITNVTNVKRCAFATCRNTLTLKITESQRNSADKEDLNSWYWGCSAILE